MKVGPEYLVEFVKRVTLFPGWKIEAHAGTLTGDVRMQIVTRVPNAQSAAHEEVPVVNVRYYPPNMQVEPSFWHEEVRRNVLNLLAHEVDEWFRIDGKFYRAPHPENEKEVWKP